MKHLSLCMLLLLGAVVAQAQDYKPTLVTPPAGMATTFMTVTTTPSDYYGAKDAEEWPIIVGSADGHVYIQGLFPDYPDEWVVGTANDTKTRITFPQGQFLGIDFGFELYFSGFRDKAGARCDFVLQRSSTTGLLTADATMGYCAYYADGNSYLPFTDRYASITITPSSPWEPPTPGKEPEVKKEPVTVPDGVTWQNYTMTATNFRTGRITHPTRLAFDGDDVYMADFSNVAIQTQTCAKGRRVGNTITFPQEQFLVSYSGTHDMYLYGATYYLGDADVRLSELTFTYDPMTDTYTGSQGLLVSDGKFRETGNFSEFLQDVVLQGTYVGIQEPTAPRQQSAEAYDITGRRVVRTKSPGVFLKGGLKILRR